MVTSGASPVPSRRVKKVKQLKHRPNFVSACEAYLEERQERIKNEPASAPNQPRPSMLDMANAHFQKQAEKEKFHEENEMPMVDRQGIETSKTVRRFVQETTRPVHDLFSGYRDVGLEEIMEQRYRVNLLAYYVEVQGNLTDYLGRAPTVDEWAGSMDMAVKELKTDIMRSQQVQSRLVSKHLGLINSVAQTYRGKGLPMRDLVQEGSCGLIHAAEKFDPARGYAFSTYARHWIRQHISRALARHARMIRLPQRVHEKVVTMGKVRTEMSTVLGRDPTLLEVAERAHVAPQVARFYAAAAAPVRSVDSAVRTSKGSHRSDHLEASASATITIEDRLVDTVNMRPEEEVEGLLLKRELEKKLLSVLPEVEREIILLRFGLKDGRPRSYDEVIESMQGYPEIQSKKCVIKAETRAFYKLRKPSIINQLSELRSCVSDYEAISTSTGAPREDDLTR